MVTWPAVGKILAAGLHFWRIVILRMAQKNSQHLELMTHQDNCRESKRKIVLATHCANGHEYNTANTYIFRGVRNCRVCAKERQRRIRQKNAKYSTMEQANAGMITVTVPAGYKLMNEAEQRANVNNLVDHA